MVLERLTGREELMDLPGADPAELLEALRHLARINRYLGGVRLVTGQLPRLLLGAVPPIRILDVGTGYADIPRAIVDWARNRGLEVEIVALERREETVEIAARACASYPEIRVEKGATRSAEPTPKSSSRCANPGSRYRPTTSGSLRSLRGTERTC